VTLHENDSIAIDADGNAATISLPPVSWTVMHLR